MQLPAAARTRSFEVARATTEILKLSERPDVVSFAGGLPDPGVFRLEAIRAATDRVLAEDGRAALNYGPNAGFPPLRAWIADRMAQLDGVAARPEEILITSGSLEAFHLLCGICLEPGDVVLVGEPTYLVALHVLHCFQARPVAVPLDEAGLRVELVRDTLQRLARDAVRPKFLYCIPSFQNPSGWTLSLERRRELVELARERDLILVEDHAYAELRYAGDPLPSLKSLAPEQVILLHTFSKIFGPGVRLGWACAPADVVQRMALYKIGTDQCASPLAQRLVYEYGRSGALERQLAESIPRYRGKRDRMLESLQRHLGGRCRWTRPDGGFFTWVTLPDGVCSTALLQRALQEEKVAFVAGPPFFTAGGEGFLRLCFSYVDAERIDDGIARLARVVEQVAESRGGTES